MLSARRPLVPIAVGAGIALLLCGCTTTQTTAARLQLNDARLRATAEAVHVGSGATSAAVSVLGQTTLAQASGAVTAVTLENRGARPVSDLPISVGYRLAARVVYLNGAAGIDYFSNHIPSIGAHARLTWVYESGAKLPIHAQVFIRVGAEPSVATGPIRPPRITATVGAPRAVASSPRSGSTSDRSLRISLRNASSIPQYQLPVYGTLTRQGHVIAAFAASVADLAGGARAEVHVLSRPAGLGADSIQVQAPATIFR